MIADRNIDKIKFTNFILDAIDFFGPQVKARNIDIEQYIDKMVNKGTIAYKEDYNQIVGAVIGYMHDTNDNTSYITQVYVNPNYRGKGFSGMLLQEYADYAKKIGIVKIWLTTKKSNLTAQAVYENSGFIIEETFKHELLYKYVMNL